MADWQPMDTAPKTGPARDILLACLWKNSWNRAVVVAHWAHGGGEDQPAFGPAWFYRGYDGFSELPSWVKPTHWMPLPELPKIERGELWCDHCRSFVHKPECVHAIVNKPGAQVLYNESDCPGVILLRLQEDTARAMKPCPFCAHRSVELVNTHTPAYWMECGSCGCKVPDPRRFSVRGDGMRSHRGSALRAIEAWNSRVSGK